ncbi:heterokaryon incompatibility protein-domain-containing protein [Xylariomycetidae sp. FL0641]|nr:heterokaryon incompatibility protein-domain-containing protein [Xylariomycetidae sp. FL0641]
MRLLNTATLRLETHLWPEPEYAILSHRWEEEEILYEDVTGTATTDWKRKKGYTKWKKSCEVARKYGYKYIWNDTCCIDKTSSAELSEAINSMFRWYRRADVCFAFLSDVTTMSDLDSSAWFTRGWTLQELIAPDEVLFFNKNWNFITDRSSSLHQLEQTTGIDQKVLAHGQDPRQPDFSIALDFHNTEAEEDIRAILDVGLLDVNMPLLYGEGDKAFLRLQEEVIKRWDDQSLLAWTRSGATYPTRYGLARKPAHFAGSDIKLSPTYGGRLGTKEARQQNLHFSRQGLQASLYMYPEEKKHGPFYGILDCTMGNNPLARPAILLERVHRGKNAFKRLDTNLLYSVEPGHRPDEGIVRVLNQPKEPLYDMVLGRSRQLIPFSETSSEAVGGPFEEHIDLSAANIRTIEIRDMETHREVTRRHTLPPLRVKGVVDTDPGSWMVEHIEPGARTNMPASSPTDYSFGAVLLMKWKEKRWQKFCVTWTTGEDCNASCSIHAVDEDLQRTFQSVKRGITRLNEFSLPLKYSPEFPKDRTQLSMAGRMKRISAEISHQVFLGMAMLELEINIKDVRT